MEGGAIGAGDGGTEGGGYTTASVDGTHTGQPVQYAPEVPEPVLNPTGPQPLAAATIALSAHQPWESLVQPIRHRGLFASSSDEAARPVQPSSRHACSASARLL